MFERVRPRQSDETPEGGNLKPTHRGVEAADAGSRQMTLTPDLVAQVHRVLDAPGPDPKWAYHSNSDYDAVVQILLTSRPGPKWWKPSYSVATAM
jgi:hypothetical protein